MPSFSAEICHVRMKNPNSARVEPSRHAQTRTHSENMAEAAAREAGPASVSQALVGKGALVDQPTSDLERAVDILKGYLSEERVSRMQDVLDQRTRSAALVFENPANPNNVSGALAATTTMRPLVCYPSRCVRGRS